MGELIPLFDTQKNEKLESDYDNWVRNYKNRVVAFPEINKKEPERPNGNPLPQDACGGYQWNARLEKWTLK